MKILPVLFADSYKMHHFKMYPEGLVTLFSNMTPRKSRFKTQVATWFGLQYYLKEYMIKLWNEEFFQKPLEDILSEYKRFHKYFSFAEVETTHIEKLHKLGYLPISIYSLPEGSKVPMKVPFYVIWNTHPDHAWLVNFLETQMSVVIWDLTTVATIASEYRTLLDKWALKTTGSKEGVQWQGHDFAMRGRSSFESSMNQAGHLLYFTGSDTIPAVLALEKYYNANIETELVGSSVPATEHSVMTSYGKENEIDAFKRLMDQFPKGILSIVSDSFDLWKVLTDFMPKLKETILARNGKIVIRPDSGDPVDIICGFDLDEAYDEEGEGDFKGKRIFERVVSNENRYGYVKGREILAPEQKGVIELLWEEFGGTVNEKGYKVLDPHVGAIYGDSITLDRADKICRRLEAKGFASTNIVLGIGSYTYNYNTRDSLGIAVKSTYCEVAKNIWDEGDRGITYSGIEEREIFKDPITDDGTKKSAKGLIAVYENLEGSYYMKDRATWDEVKNCSFQKVFENGNLLIDQSLAEIRKTANL